MPLIAITGTPGTGKTSVSEELRRRGRRVIDLNEHIRDRGLLGERDEERDTYCVDADGLRESLSDLAGGEGEAAFAEGHMAHCLDFSAAIVLRCSPRELAARLEARGYPPSKVRENVQAEVIDVILCEAAESGAPVYEIDCTSIGPSAAADAIEAILGGDTDKYLPGNVSWLGELEEWF
ncbi:MAG: adenylate kinase family protein [Candidatus Methanoplasma sp.]|jgi:adenylate kinase|nr:adenylate kinase family protein [Candidatus Methanoplasma sp.]